MLDEEGPFDAPKLKIEQAFSGSAKSSELEPKMNMHSYRKPSIDGEGDESATDDDDSARVDSEKITADMNKSFCQKFCSLLLNPSFLCMLFSITFLYFIITGI